LDPENAEFLSKVRYIITSKERKIFLELPDSEKKTSRKNSGGAVTLILPQKRMSSRGIFQLDRKSH